MTKTGRRYAPLLAGLTFGALVAVLCTVAAPTGEVPLAAPAPAPVAAAMMTDEQDMMAAPGPMAMQLPTAAPPAMPAARFGQPAAAAVPALPFIPAPPPNPSPPRPSPKPTGQGAALLALTNAQRAEAGCRPLRLDGRLTKAAQQHSEEMAEEGYFSHDAPSGSTFASRERATGFDAEKTGGENIARGQKNAQTVMRDWMGSPPHRKNILNCEFTTIGIGYVPDGHYWTQDFGY